MPYCPFLQNAPFETLLNQNKERWKLFGPNNNTDHKLISKIQNLHIKNLQNEYLESKNMAKIEAVPEEAILRRSESVH